MSAVDVEMVEDSVDEGRGALRIVKIPVGPLRANAYLLTCGDSAVVIDPGDEADAIAAEVARRGCRLQAVWLTHAHFDHVGGLSRLLELSPAPFYLHSADEPLLANARNAAARWGFEITAPPLDYVPLSAGQQLVVGRHVATVLHVPGHAPGHVAFHFREHLRVLSGDVLFRGSVGRTDVPLGDHDTLLRSIAEELLVLDDGTVVLPGHGPNTTIGVERAENPFLNG